MAYATISKVKWSLNPINVLCTIMVFIIMVTVLTSGQPRYTFEDAHTIGRDGTHYHDGKECQYEGLECPILRQQHVCIDSTHLNCDGECSCDGMECPATGTPYKFPITHRDMHEYQVEVVPGYTIWYDHGKALFVVPMDRGCNLTKAIEKDNQ